MSLVRLALRNLLVNAIEHSEGRPIDIWIASDADAVAVAPLFTGRRMRSMNIPSTLRVVE